MMANRFAEVVQQSWWAIQNARRCLYRHRKTPSTQLSSLWMGSHSHLGEDFTWAISSVRTTGPKRLKQGWESLSVPSPNSVPSECPNNTSLKRCSYITARSSGQNSKKEEAAQLVFSKTTTNQSSSSGFVKFFLFYECENNGFYYPGIESLRFLAWIPHRWCPLRHRPIRQNYHIVMNMCEVQLQYMKIVNGWSHPLKTM